jgi:serine/threonine-protein phosphatase PPG1
VEFAADSLGHLAICLACLVSPRFAGASLPGTDVLSPSASVDLDECIESLYKKNLLAESVIEAICAKTKELLMQESNVVHVQAPVTVVGDIHGQFFDLIEIFKIGGWCPDTNYLFLGTISDTTETSHVLT